MKKDNPLIFLLTSIILLSMSFAPPVEDLSQLLTNSSWKLYKSGIVGMTEADTLVLDTVEGDTCNPITYVFDTSGILHYFAYVDSCIIDSSKKDTVLWQIKYDSIIILRSYSTLEVFDTLTTDTLKVSTKITNGSFNYIGKYVFHNH